MNKDLFNKRQETIDRDTALERLVSVFPELRGQWTRYIKFEYKNYKDERLDYIDMHEIIRFIVDRKKAGETEGFKIFFGRVEEILTTGDGYTQELIVIGLLEGIQNFCGGEVNYHTGFNEWLLSKTKKAWGELIHFWEGNGSEKKDN